MKIMVLSIIMMCLLIPTGFGELLTKQEIASVIESEVRLNPEQLKKVVDVVYDMFSIVEIETDIAINEAVALHEAEVDAITAKFTITYDSIYSEKELWKIGAFIGGGIIVVETALLIITMVVK